MFGVQSQLLGMVLGFALLAAGVGAAVYADWGRPASGAESGIKFTALMDRAMSEAQRTGAGATIAFATSSSGPTVQIYAGTPWASAGVGAAADNGLQNYPQNVRVSLAGVAAQPPFAIFIAPDDRVSAAVWSAGEGAIAQPGCIGSLTLTFVAGAANGATVTNSYAIGCADGAATSTVGP